jgi:hypothetical protein
MAMVVGAAVVVVSAAAFPSPHPVNIRSTLNTQRVMLLTSPRTPLDLKVTPLQFSDSLTQPTRTQR